MTEAVTIDLPSGGGVSGLLSRAVDAAACVVLAHGAGAGMRHPFMEAVAGGLSRRGIATLRFDFPFMERRSRRPDSAAVATASVRAAIAAAAALMPGVPLVAGGKSFGGRMSSLAQAAAPLPGVRGLVVFGFPLHTAGKPSATRAAHLVEIAVPMLFLQGGRDAMADPAIAATELGRHHGATLFVSADADHSFHVPKRSGRNDAEVMDTLLDVAATWIVGLVGPAAGAMAPGSGEVDGSHRPRPRSPA